MIRAIHLNDVANTGKGFTSGLNAVGVDTELYPLKLLGSKGAAQLNTWTKILALPWRVDELWSFNRYIKEKNFDVVHIHYGYLGITALLGRYPYFLHLHGGDLYQNLNRLVLKQLTILSIKRAYQVYYSTPDLYNNHGLNKIRADADFLPNPIDTDFFCPRGDGGVTRNTKVLIIQRLDEVKGLDIFFQLIPHLVAKYPLLEFTAFKIGTMVSKYSDIPRITFIDRVPYEQMPNVILEHDLVIGQFRLGCIGMCELESMACAKPLIANFELSNVYEKSPPLFSVKDRASIWEAVCTVVENPEIGIEMGKRAREWVIKQHGIRNVASRLKIAYEQFSAEIMDV